ncbi:MAG: hypothetical protein ABIT38_09775, partial [Gemmatimonadaceae bacterium]
PRLLSLLDREARSPTRGSFDRVNWNWKFRDFPLTMWQASMMPLATLFRHPHLANPYAAQPRLAEWLGGALEETLGRQHRNGAFDSFTPYSQDHGVTLAMVLTLCTTAELLGDAITPALHARINESVARACRFAASSDEDYAFINNHQAAFALAYVRAGRMLGDSTLLDRSDDVLSRILRHQSRDGWFEEYRGPDPGYETFGLTYLALTDKERPNAELQSALARSIAFLSHCVHPDGSIGGNYGSRNTGQYAPGGLEVLAAQQPIAAAIADFVGARLEGGNVVTPPQSDDDNLPLLTFSYAVAATNAAKRSEISPTLPCEREDVWTRFDDSGVVVVATQRYYAVSNFSKGGVLRVFDRASTSLVYEDAGYFLTSSKNEWSTQLLGESTSSRENSSNSVDAVAHFAAVKRELLTPLKFLVLRVLNLTVFRSVRLGALVRRMIIARLVTGRKRGAWTLRRRVTFGANQIELVDRVEPSDSVRVTFASLERSLLPIHMGSAKYFHANELSPLPPVSLDGWAAELSAGRSTSLRQVIGFSEDGVVHSHDVGIATRTAVMERPSA